MGPTAKTLLVVGAGAGVGYLAWRFLFKEDDVCAGFGVGAGASTGAALGGPWGAVVGAGASLLCPVRDKITSTLSQVFSARGARDLGTAAKGIVTLPLNVGKAIVNREPVSLFGGSSDDEGLLELMELLKRCAANPGGPGCERVRRV